MFYGKKIKELELSVNALESRAHELAHSVHAQSEEIDRLYARLVAQEAKAHQPKPKKPKKQMFDGKEKSKATK
jgi:phosphate uptake regulator